MGDLAKPTYPILSPHSGSFRPILLYSMGDFELDVERFLCPWKRIGVELGGASNHVFPLRGSVTAPGGNAGVLKRRRQATRCPSAQMNAPAGFPGHRLEQTSVATRA